MKKEEVQDVAAFAATLPVALRRSAFTALLRPPEPAIPVAAPLPLGAAFASLGLSAGVFAGLSESPVGATIVGGLLALVGGGGLVAPLLVRDKPLRYAPAVTAYAVICLCFTCVLGGLLGISLRTGYWSKVPATPVLVDVPTKFPALAPVQKLRLQLLQIALKRAGLATEGSNAMITLAAQSAAAAPLSVRPTTGAKLLTDFGEYTSELKVTQTEFDSLHDDFDQKLNEKSCPGIPATEFDKLHYLLAGVKRGIRAAYSRADELRGEVEGGLQPELEQWLDLVRRENGSELKPREDDESEGDLHASHTGRLSIRR